MDATLQTFSSAAADELATLPRLGVGLLYVPSLPRFVREHVEALDYLAIVPDRFWADNGPGAGPRYREMEKQVELLDWVAVRIPVVGHSVGLSIGSAELFDTGHVEQVARWQARYGFPWHSDHLSFNRVPGLDAHSNLAGLAIPVPYDREVRGRVPVPFLLENNVYYVDLPEQEMSEPEFRSPRAAGAGC